MHPRDVAALRLEGDYAGRLRWYRLLYHALAGARPPAGAIFEASSEATGGPTVLVRPAALADSLRRAPAGVLVRVAGVPIPPAPAPPPGARSKGGLLLPGPAPKGPAREEAPLPAETAPLAPLGAAGAWFGVQAFWLNRGGFAVEVAVRFRVGAPDRSLRDRASDALAARLLSDWRQLVRAPARVAASPHGTARDWHRGTVRRVPAEAWAAPPEPCPGTAELGLGEFVRGPTVRTGHTVVFGASGAGKTTFLTERAARAIERGQPVVVLDLHGDLAPRLLGRLPAEARRRVVAVDASERPVPGLAGLVAGAASVDRAAAHFVAAVKRLSPDGTELAWGFRLERIFDTFARAVLEQGGSIVDLYALLTDPDRRDAARLAARRPTVARFLDELGPILRRDPEFLWSAATRLSKVVLVPALVDLLAPADGGLDAEGLLEQGRALLVRLPLAALGPESSAFAATLVLGRLYLGLAARTPRVGPRPVLLVLDEVQALSPRLVAELLAEGRKFGVEALVATQYPDRLAPEVRSAAAGAASAFVALRVPPASAASVGPWVGLSPGAAAEVLPALPVGVGFLAEPERAGPTPIAADRSDPGGSHDAWREQLAATRAEFGVEGEGEDDRPLEEALPERLLLAILAAGEQRRPLAASDVPREAASLPGAAVPPELLERAWNRLQQGPEVEAGATGVRLTVAGERRLGLGRATQATRETSEHRALLLRAFRLFARRGYRIEILRQGRFDTTLPDAVFRQLGSEERRETPSELAAKLDRVRSGWAWRFFRGRDVHIEAEVSGALRADRVRHGCAKAFGRGAFVVFVVGDAGRARRVRRVLRERGLGPDVAQVWTLPGPTGASLPNG